MLSPYYMQVQTLKLLYTVMCISNIIIIHVCNYLNEACTCSDTIMINILLFMYMYMNSTGTRYVYRPVEIVLFTSKLTYMYIVHVHVHTTHVCTLHYPMAVLQVYSQ